MKKIKILFSIVCMAAMLSCNNNEEKTTTTDSTPAAAAASGGQEAVKDDVSEKDVVKIAVSSKDHTTLVAALKQADLVTSLSNAGPFTVFAPTNAAFDKLPAGTVDGLMKDDKKEDLQNILQYHVYVGVLEADALTDGQIINEVNGGNIKITIVDGKPVINGKAHIVASIKASNGISHVIDEVLLPPAQ